MIQLWHLPQRGLLASQRQLYDSTQQENFTEEAPSSCKSPRVGVTLGTFLPPQKKIGPKDLVPNKSEGEI
jgi:hypothetical protein